MITQWENKMAFVNVTNKSDVNLHGVKPGGSVKIEVDKEGTPKTKEWRRRLKDSKVDGCIEIEEEKETE